MNNTLLHWLLAAFAPIVWGSTYFVTQKWLPGADPVWVAAVRVGIPAVFMVWLVPLRVWREFGVRLLMMSALNITLFTSLLFYSISTLPGGVAATLVSTLPLQVIVLRFLMGKGAEPAHVIAALGGVAGVGMLLWRADAPLDVSGVTAALAAAFVMASGILLASKYSADIQPLQLTAAQISLGGVCLFVFAILSGHPFPEVTDEGVLAMLWMGPVGMGVAYWSWFRAMRSVPVHKLAFLGLLNPVVAVLGGVLLMEEVLSGGQVVAMVIILACILCAQLAGRSQAGTKSAA